MSCQPSGMGIDQVPHYCVQLHLSFDCIGLAAAGPSSIQLSLASYPNIGYFELYPLPRGSNQRPRSNLFLEDTVDLAALHILPFYRVQSRRHYHSWWAKFVHAPRAAMPQEVRLLRAHSMTMVATFASSRTRPWATSLVLLLHPYAVGCMLPSWGGRG